jgi:hypothetical protein
MDVNWIDWLVDVDVDVVVGRLLVQVQSAHSKGVLTDSQRDQLKMIIFGRPPLGPLRHLIHRGDPVCSSHLSSLLVMLLLLLLPLIDTPLSIPPSPSYDNNNNNK